MSKSAAELMAELAGDKDYLARKDVQAKNNQSLERRCASDEEVLVSELRKIGLPVNSIWDLVNSRDNYSDAVPVLLAHLKIVHHLKILQGISRSLAIPALSENDDLWGTLIDLYKNTPPNIEIGEPENRGAQEAIAIALESLATRSRHGDLKNVVESNPGGDGVCWLREKLECFKVDL